MKNHITLQECLNKAKKALKQKNYNDVYYYTDLGSTYVLINKDSGVEEDEKIEGTKLNLWRERFYSLLEVNNLLRE